ncbi:MAG: hypothetical protein PHO48_05060 [Candidatus Gracilibacteria bacterium]|nr:hypothetical protein [Candidatus Gracilibacteria bacterium]MDD5179376.1 hypothetical protein [Candidatus Gracilibacteria bacterium]
MQNPFHHFDWSFKSIAKIFGFVFGGLVALSLMAVVVTFAFRTIAQPFLTGVTTSIAPSYRMESASDYSMNTKAVGGYAISQNIMPPIPGEDGIATNAEDYEVKEYSASYRVNDKTEICETVATLKADKDIIFSSANESDRSCDFYFKVIKAKTPEVIELLKTLNPDDFTTSAYTIQKSVKGATDQLEILKKKLAQTEATLNNAQTSYEELFQLATKKGDIESLTKLIDLKINMIERLAQEKLSTSAEMESVERNRADLLEKLDYNEFRVYVNEERLVDWQNMRDNWKYEIQNFVNNLNSLTQWVSVKFVSYTLNSFVALAYLGVGFIFLKGAWILGKKVWFYKKK